MKTRKHDYLKYWRVIHYYTRIKYGLSSADLDLLVFLYSERYFTSKKFKEFEALIPWDKSRFKRLMKDGWIENFRPGRGYGHKALYGVSYKTSRAIGFMYKKLNGEEIPMNSVNNPLFKKNVRYTDKVYRNMIKKMNAYRKESEKNGIAKDPFEE